MKLPLNTLISTSTAKDPTKDKIALLTKFTKNRPAGKPVLNKQFKICVHPQNDSIPIKPDKELLHQS